MGLEKFSAALDLLTGFNVNLYVGEDVFKGNLIGVEADHVVLEAENKYIFYYTIDKIQAITKNTKQFQPEKLTAEFQKTQSLTELLQSFQHSWVTILCINKQKFSGVLSEIDTDFATLINGEERILIKLTHISNILKGFIKEEKSKLEETKEKAQNNNETKNNENETCQTAENKTGNKSRQTTKAVCTTFEKKEKTTAHRETSEVQPEVVAAAEIIEPTNIMVWSEPIKIEAPVTIQKEDHSFKSEKPESSVETGSKVKTDMKKPNNEMNQIVKKNDELSMNKPKQTEQVKEMKPVKEAVMKVETKPVAILPSPKKEVKSRETTSAAKPVKSRETTTTAKPVKSKETTTTTKPVQSQNTASRKTEDTKTERFVNDTKNVWKQRDQEKVAFRFSGEPVSRDTERAFPFAGWPNRNKNKRTFRF